MAVVNGLGGSVTFASGYASNVTDWSISFAGAELDTTAMGTTGNWETYIGGRRSWTGTYTAWWDSTGSNILGADGAAATTGIADAPAAATFRFADDTTDGTIAGNIIITGIETNVTTDSANTLTFTFRGTSSPTFTKSA